MVGSILRWQGASAGVQKCLMGPCGEAACHRSMQQMRHELPAALSFQMTHPESTSRLRSAWPAAPARGLGLWCMAALAARLQACTLPVHEKAWQAL